MTHEHDPTEIAQRAAERVSEANLRGEQVSPDDERILAAYVGRYGAMPYHAAARRLRPDGSVEWVWVEPQAEDDQ